MLHSCTLETYCAFFRISINIPPPAELTVLGYGIVRRSNWSVSIKANKAASAASLSSNLMNTVLKQKEDGIINDPNILKRITFRINLSNSV